MTRPRASGSSQRRSPSPRGDPVDLTEYLGLQRQRIDEALARVLPGPPDSPASVSDAMRYSVLAGGKRLRPILTLGAADAVALAGGEAVPRARAWALALPAACAIELIHTYSLVHDDLPAMDDDTLRRGRPTCHVVHGEGMAILAGDGLLTEAFALMAREPENGAGPALAQRKLRAIALVAQAAGATGMVGGQAIDLQAVGAARPSGTHGGHDAPRLTGDELRAMHARKTGALIRAAVMVGIVMAGGTDGQLRAAGQYGSELGLAFQIVDDILDVEGAPEQLGKTTGKDEAAGKPTYPALYGLDESRRLATRAIARAQTALDTAGLGARLGEIADWVLARTS